jgi:hypothetical protein
MRAIVLLLLAGSVLWLVLRTESVEEPAGPAREVTFLGSEQDVLAAAPQPEPTPGSSEAPLPAPSPAPTEPPAEFAVAAPPVGPSSTALDSSGELELASELAHRPAGMESLLQSRSASLSAGRRELVLTLAHAILGGAEAAERAGAALWDEPSAGTAAERGLLRQARASGSQGVVPVWTDTPLARAGSIALLAREGREALGRREHQRAAEAFTTVLSEELKAPWPADAESLRIWSAELSQAQAGYQWSRKGGWPSVEVTVEKGDSLISIRKRVLRDHPELLVSTGLIERVNQTRGDTIQPGQVLRVPVERAHALVDVDARWVLYFLGDLVAGAWEVGVGKRDSETPPGTYTVGDKHADPMWFPPGRQPVPFGDPENPLGTRWIGWVGSDGRNSGLAFHGTKDPDSIGQDQSQGCIRMLNRDVEELYEILPKGALVVVQP